MPKGNRLILFIVTILYIIVTLVLTGMVHYSKLNVADAVAFALREVGLGWREAIFLLYTDLDYSMHLDDLCSLTDSVFD